VLLFLESDVIFIQDPLLYCSPQRAPNLAKEKLSILSTLGLQAPSFIEPDVKNTSGHLAATSQTVASSSKDFDLNLTMEEYNRKFG